MSMSLYEIKESYLKFLTMIEMGEVSEEAIKDTIESLDGDFEEKVDGIACFIKNLSAEADAIKLEEKVLKERREQKEKKIESLKSYLSDTMQQLKKTKFETSRNVLSFRKSTVLNISDEEAFIKKYPDLVKVEIKKSIPKKDITDLIKSGKVIEGAEIVEKLNLQIK